MSANAFVIVELGLVLGGVLLFGIWQLRTTARDQKATRERDAAAARASERTE